jgi:uncharacterized Zn finger protein
MTRENVPRLTEAQVRQLGSQQSFERGKSYYRDGAILEPVRQGLELRAQCEGSEDEPYKVSATLDQHGIVDASCTCPYDWGGACKHIVALLLTYVHEPQTFHIIPPLETLLAESSREQLMALIREMVKREPGLLSMVELAAVATQPGDKNQASKPRDVSTYRRQARRAMHSESPHRIESELRALRAAAVRVAQADDWLNAGAIYHAALSEAVQGYDDMVQSMDDDGDIAIVIDELAQGLCKSLQLGQADATTRQEWLGALLEAELTDIEMGGIDLAPSAREAVLEHANAAEWAWIEERVRAAILQSRDWARSALVRLLAEGLERCGRKDDAEALIRDLGTPEQQAHLLISTGKIDAALELIKTIVVGKPGLVTQFADALVQAGAQTVARALVLEHGSDHWSHRDWLAQYYRQYGTPQEAVEAQQQVLLGAPSVEAFQTLRQVSRKAGTWEQVRASVLNALQRQKNFGALVDIALHEGDVARALELLPRVSDGWHDYTWEVAQAAEKEHPHAAIGLYQELAERAITQKSRGAYQQATTYLKRVKQLYGRLKAPADWETYVQALHTRYPTLRALHDELRKAQL